MQLRIRIVLVATLAALMAACTTTRQVRDIGFHAPQGNYKLIVLEPDITVGQLTAGGVVETREDWTKQARTNVVQALTAQQAIHGGDVKVAADRQEVGFDPGKLSDLMWLHKAVGNSILIHKYLNASLPTKKDRFDWTLGNEAVQFGAATHYDYALFLHAEDSFESGGRMALQVAGMLSCVIGVCILPSGGQQAAFASLVDLKTGQVVWFNFLASTVGDIRTPEGAQKMVTTLLSGMQSAKPVQPHTT
jgi:hypothetical protein